MSTGKFRIAIIGGSVAGLTSAIGLSRLPNTDIEVFERLTESGTVNGALYQIWPNGLNALKNISERALHEVVSRAWPLERIVNRDSSGAVLKTIEIPAKKYGKPGINITRQSLIEGLRASLPGEIVVHYGSTVSDVRAGNASDLVELHLDGGERTRPFDLVLIADGRASRFRSQVLTGAHSLTHHKWSAFVGQSGSNQHLEQAARQNDFQIFYSKGSVCGICPLGDRVTWFLTFTNKTEDLVWQAIKKNGTLDSADLRGKQEFATALAGKWFSAPEPFHAISNADWQASVETMPVLWRMKDLDSPRQIVRDRLALVGDAGHVLLPVTGQGAAMAFEDVDALVNCLQSAKESSKDQFSENVPELLRAYEKKRIPRLRQVFRLTRLEAKRSYAPDHGISTSLRNTMIKFAPDGIVYAVLDQLIGQPS